MLPLPNLDDQNFRQIFENARKMVSAVYPEWTDLNYHDPGMTIIEMFSYLKDMQQYYMNQISDKNRQKYLKLLGYEKFGHKRAKAEITLSTDGEDIFLPRGSRAYAGNAVFETENSLCVLNNEIMALNSYCIGENKEFSIPSENMIHYIFGKKPVTGNIFELEFRKPLPVGLPFCINIQIFSQYKVKRNPILEGQNVKPLAKKFWQYFTKDGWKDIEEIKDGTFTFMQDGIIRFMINEPVFMKENKYAIRCVLAECDFDVAPRLSGISLNSVKVLNGETLSSATEYKPGEITDEGKFTAAGLLNMYGDTEIEILTEKGWIFIDKKDYTKTLEEKGGYCIFKLNKVKVKDFSALRVTAWQEKFKESRFAGKGNGMPFQKIPVSFAFLDKSNFKIQVSSTDEYGKVWQDWSLVNDFDASKPHSKHFIIDEKEGVICFGDNEMGMSPGAGEDVLIISSISANAREGNVKAGNIDRMEERYEYVKVFNAENAFGGEEGETIDEAVTRFRKDLKLPGRAITAQDYEELVYKVPGLMINKVRAIPLYKPGLANYPDNKAENCISIAVEFFGENKKNNVNQTYVKNILNYLEDYRLITTEIYVIPPEYVAIDIQCEIKVKLYYVNPEKVIEDALYGFFNTEWDFGKMLSYGDVYAVIDSLDPVKGIKSLSIKPKGKNIIRDSSGNIKIPPNGIIYINSIDVKASE